jgi:hypothetical protein
VSYAAPRIPVSEEGALIARIAQARLDRLEGPEAGGSDQTPSPPALPDGARITKLCALFGAAEVERVALMTVAAPLFDPRLTARYHAATGRGWVTDWLVELLFPEFGPVLVESGFLVHWGIIELQDQGPGEPPAITGAPELRGWIAGQTGVPKALAETMSVVPVLPPLPSWPVVETATRVRAALERHERVCMTIPALEGAGRASFAAAVAAALGQRTLLVDPARRPGAWGRADTVAVHRTALALGAALVWRAVPRDDGLCPLGLWPTAVQAVTLPPGDTVLPPPELAPIAVDLPPLDTGDRAALIAERVPASAGWDAESRASLAERRSLTPGAITRMARLAPETGTQALAAASLGHANGMGELARRVPSDLSWDDLVLPELLKDDLRDLAFEARARGGTFSNGEIARLFRRESGLVTLFHGAPGTGKTMAAQVLAHELQLDLYRIDCSAVISKYIGETAKNMKEIFARARAVDAVLFFDEADALFARRTEVKDSHDRHANTDTSYLLQLIEGDFDGIAVLATNRLGDMDPAFLRRIRYVFEIPRPDAAARTEIWRRAGGTLSPETPRTLWPLLGDVLDFTGAQVKTCLLTAHFTARRRGEPLGSQDVLRAVDREMAKEGRSLGSRERERIRHA